MRFFNVVLWVIAEIIALKILFTKVDMFQSDEASLEHDNQIKKIWIGTFALIAAVSGWLVSGSVQSMLDCIKVLVVYVAFSMAAMTDMKSYIIPNFLVISMIVIRVILFVPEFFMNNSNFLNLLIESIVGGTICLVVLLLISIITKGGLGMGDVKLLTAQGITIGLYGVINTVLYALVSCMVGALIMLASKRKKLTDKLPFGPYIYAGFVICILLGSY